MPVPDQSLRVRLASPTAAPDDELPFRILVLSDLAGRPLPVPLGDRRPLPVHPAALGAALAGLRPSTEVCAPDRLGLGRSLACVLAWDDPAGLDERSIIAQVPELTACERRRLALLAPGRDPAGRLTADIEAALLAERIAAQVAAIRERPEVRRLDAAWLALTRLATHVDPAQGVEVLALPVTRQELEDDLGDAPDPAASGLYRTVYADEYGQHGGRPWALIVCDLAYGGTARDLALLRRLAALGTIAHVPVVADAAPGLLGLADWSGLDAVDDVAAALAGPGLAAWNAWRSHEDARHAALVLPPVPLRAPVAPAGDWLWGAAALVLAARLADCHARHRWCAQAAGAGPEAEVAWPTAAFPALAGAEPLLPAAVLVDEALAADLAAQGLIALCAARRRSAIAFPALPTLHRAADPAAAQLPLVLLADRIAHHLKVLSRERLGGHVERAGLERELSDWLDRHVADSRVADPALRAARPLRGAEVRVHEVPGRAGWMRAELRVRPHLPGAGSDVELALVSCIERGTR